MRSTDASSPSGRSWRASATPTSPACSTAASRADGQPYFAIEYVGASRHHGLLRGAPTGDRRSASGSSCDVCEAVRYAHQNLVIHRDLKPVEHPGHRRRQAKLLDFGIAKLLSRSIGRRSAGSPRPGSGVDDAGVRRARAGPGRPVTTATDVYALGAVLYELLTGRRAHQLESHTPTEVERVVCQVEPEAPSAVATGGLRKRLSGDLDTITLKALKKEPDRRYPTVEQLASDIRRHLDGLPVTARADTLRYRAAKFVGRHRLGVAAAAAVALSLVGGLAGTVWQARVAAERARVASAEAAKERAVRDFLVRLFQASAPGNSLGRDVTARELLDRGRHNLDTALAAQPAVRAELLSVVANVYGALGLAPQADTLFAQAIGLTRTLPGNADAELASALTGWAGNLIMQSKFDRAEPLLEEAIQRLRQRDPDNPSVAEPLRALGRTQTYTGNHARAETLIREALAIDLRHHGVGSPRGRGRFGCVGLRTAAAGSSAGRGQRDQPCPRYLAQAPRARRPIAALDPEQSGARAQCAGQRCGGGATAQGGRRWTAPDLPPGPLGAGAHVVGLGGLLAARRRYAEAESLTAPAVAMHRSLLGPDNNHAAMLLENLADFRYQLGHFEAASTTCAKHSTPAHGRWVRRTATRWRRWTSWASTFASKADTTKRRHSFARPLPGAGRFQATHTWTSATVFGTSASSSASPARCQRRRNDSSARRWLSIGHRFPTDAPKPRGYFGTLAPC